MKRMDAISEIAGKAADINALIVGNIGIPCKELHCACDTASNFYMLGSMGLASSIGLGLALSLPERNIISIDGDGSMLMNMGSLATIAWQAPENYLLMIVDNGAYGSTGNQLTATSKQTNLAEVAKGAGNMKVYETNTKEELRQVLQETDNGIIVARVLPGNADVPNIKISPEDILERFMAESSRP